MRPFLEEVIDALVARHGTTTRIDLNDIAEVIGSRAVSYEDVELILTTLEGRGCQVGGEPTVREMGLLAEVLGAVRRLKENLGRQPTVEEIAEDAGHPTWVVRRAVENGGAMGAKPTAN